MALTALRIAEDASAAAGLAVPATLTSAGERQALALLNRAGRHLAEHRGSAGQTWPQLMRRHTLTLVAEQEYYPLPAGFGGLVINTTWSGRDREPAIGPTTPGDWSFLKGGVIGYVGPTFYYRIARDPVSRVTGMQIHPVPSEESTITFDYMSRFWVRESAGAESTLDAVTADAHLTVFPDELMILSLDWRLRAAEGLDPSAPLGEFELRLRRIFTQLTGDSARRVNLYDSPRRRPDVRVVGYD